MKTEGYIKTSDNGKIFYTEQGNGQPVVFVHGWSSYGEHSFGHMADALEGTGMNLKGYSFFSIYRLLIVS